jgi:hypothetical protein
LSKTEIILAVVASIFLLSALWFANEHRKKFGFMDSWATRSGRIVEYYYPGPKQFGRKPAMRNIVLRGNQPFSALVCMRWSIAGKDLGIDPYGVVHSDEHGVATISTFFGYGEVKFIFVPNVDAGVVATSTDEDQTLKPDATYPPHFVQKVGLYRG